jgi:hypothetical protein
MEAAVPATGEHVVRATHVAVMVEAMVTEAAMVAEAAVEEESLVGVVYTSPIRHRSCTPRTRSAKARTS